MKIEKYTDKDGHEKIAVKVRANRLELLGNRRETTIKEALPDTKPAVEFGGKSADDLPF